MPKIIQKEVLINQVLDLNDLDFKKNIEKMLEFNEKQNAEIEKIVKKHDALNNLNFVLFGEDATFIDETIPIMDMRFNRRSQIWILLAIRLFGIPFRKMKFKNEEFNILANELYFTSGLEKYIQNDDLMAFDLHDQDRRMLFQVGVFQKGINTDEYFIKFLSNILPVFTEQITKAVGTTKNSFGFAKYVVCELLANITQHAARMMDIKQAHLYEFAMHLADNHVEFLISDAGTTIPGSVEKFGPQELKGANDVEKLLWALKEGNTTKDKEKNQGGMGLTDSSNIIEQLDGEFCIASARAVYIQKKNTKLTYNLENNFHGTALFIKVPYNSFDRKIKIKEDESLKGVFNDKNN